MASSFGARPRNIVMTENEHNGNIRSEEAADKAIQKEKEGNAI